jgi:hypothetical protein
VTPPVGDAEDRDTLVLVLDTLLIRPPANDVLPVLPLDALQFDIWSESEFDGISVGS